MHNAKLGNYSIQQAPNFSYSAFFALNILASIR